MTLTARNPYLSKAWVAAHVVAILLLPSRSIADGLPGEYLLNQRWREAVVPFSPLTNPTVLVSENNTVVRSVFATTFGATFRLWELGATQPIGMYHSVGLSWVGQSTEPFEKTQDGIKQNVRVSDANNLFIATYAVNPWKSLSVGVNANVHHRDAFGESRIGGGGDIGVSYYLLRNPLLGNHIAGLSLQNILAPKLATEAQSRDLRLSLASTYWERRISSLFCFDVKDLLAQGDAFRSFDTLSSAVKTMPAKVEWAFNGSLNFMLLKMFTFRAMGGVNQTGFDYFGVAAQINMPWANLGRDLVAGVQYNAIQEDRVSMQSTSLRLELDGHREANYARKMSRRLDVAPNNLYLKAMELHGKGKYWEAHLILHQILNMYPDFFKNDMVTYYAADCQERIDMREASLSTYASVIVDYPRSPAALYAKLGTMRVHYRMEDYGQVEAGFPELSLPHITDSIRGHANYLMGEVFLRNKDYESAIAVMQQVQPGHPDYLFALHSAGVAQLSIGKAAEATDLFQMCASIEPRNEAEKTIVERSVLFTGYILYEGMLDTKHSFAKSVAVLRKIPSTSLYFAEAHQCLGWAAIKAGRLNDCSVSSEVLKNSTVPAMRAEGMLLSAYCRFLQKDMTGALDVLERASAYVTGISAEPEDSLMSEKQRYAGIRASYDLLARDVIEKARGIGMTSNPGEINKLHEQQEKMKQSIDDYLKSLDAANRSNFFARGLPQIKNDIDYSLATVLSRSSSKTRADKKNEKEQMKLDEEIEKLKQELENAQ